MIQGVLLDVGGVVAIGNAPLPGAVDAIARLKAGGLKVRFVTNITRQPHRAVVAMLRDMGIAVAPEEVFTPAIAARDWLKAHGAVPHLLVHPALEEDFAPIGGKPDTLVVGDAGDAFTYDSLNRAFRVLAAGSAWLALAQNRVFRDGDGALSLDAGAFVAALEYASGKRPVVLGKPAPGFFQAAVASMGCAADAAVMVGDDAEFDVAPAIRAGLKGLLVRTGKYAPGAETAHAPPPTAVVADIAEAADWALARR